MPSESWPQQKLEQAATVFGAVVVSSRLTGAPCPVFQMGSVPLEVHRTGPMFDTLPYVTIRVFEKNTPPEKKTPERASLRTWDWGQDGQSHLSRIEVRPPGVWKTSRC